MVALAEIVTPQSQAVSRRKTGRAPLAEIIHAELPAKRSEGLLEHETAQLEEELEATKERHTETLAQAKDLALADLAQAEEQHAENLDEMRTEAAEEKAMREGELAVAKEQAQRAEGVQAIGMGATAAYSLLKLGGEWGSYGAGPAFGFGLGYGYKQLKDADDVEAGAVGAAGGAIAGIVANLKTDLGPTYAGMLGGAMGFLGGLF